MATWNELTPAQRLAALYDAAKPQGWGFVEFSPGPLSEAEAEQIVAGSFRGHLDYVKGRVIKCCVTSEVPEFWLFDRDNGVGAGEAAILKAKGPTP